MPIHTTSPPVHDPTISYRGPELRKWEKNHDKVYSSVYHGSTYQQRALEADCVRPEHPDRDFVYLNDVSQVAKPLVREPKYILESLLELKSLYRQGLYFYDNTASEPVRAGVIRGIKNPVTNAVWDISDHTWIRIMRRKDTMDNLTSSASEADFEAVKSENVGRFIPRLNRVYLDPGVLNRRLMPREMSQSELGMGEVDPDRFMTSMMMGGKVKYTPPKVDGVRAPKQVGELLLRVPLRFVMRIPRKLEFRLDELD